ncbi:multicopper oxidase domain-containing protein, partial [Klebsiella pneumoniae]
DTELTLRVSFRPQPEPTPIDVPPGTKRSYRVTADALGRWAYHCHLLYHMEMGMFREVRVEE